MFLQKENLDLAFQTGESLGITATLVRHFTPSEAFGFYKTFGELEVVHLKLAVYLKLAVFTVR